MTTGPGHGPPDDAPTPEDTALLAELAAVLGPDAEPPAAVLDAARESLTWRTVDVELAALVFDSLLDEEPARSRSVARARSVTFESGAAAVELEVDDRPGGRRLLGQLVPPQAAEVELTGPGFAERVGADTTGRFVLPLPGASVPARLLVRLADGTRIASETTTL